MSSIFDVCRASVSLSPNPLVSDGIFTLSDIKQSCGKCHYSLILFKVKRSPGTKELRKIKNLKCHCCDFNYIVYKQIYALQARFFISFQHQQSRRCSDLVIFMSTMQFKEQLWSKLKRCFVFPYTEVKFYPEIKSQIGLSSLWVSCKRSLIFRNHTMVSRNSSVDDSCGNSFRKWLHTISIR